MGKKKGKKKRNLLSAYSLNIQPPLLPYIPAYVVPLSFLLIPPPSLQSKRELGTKLTSPTRDFPPIQLPFWALVTFGAYLVARLGWGILTFNDLPQAHAELMGEIKVAKRELRDMGVDVD